MPIAAIIASESPDMASHLNMKPRTLALRLRPCRLVVRRLERLRDEVWGMRCHVKRVMP